MKKFLVLYRSTASAMDQMASITPEQRKAEMDKWMAWGASAGTALAEWGAPLGESAVLRGSKAQGFIGGYSIVQADSLDSAKQLFDSHPHFGAPGASIELLEIQSMPGK
jgi:YCII-related domain